VWTVAAGVAATAEISANDSGAVAATAVTKTLHNVRRICIWYVSFRLNQRSTLEPVHLARIDGVIFGIVPERG